MNAAKKSFLIRKVLRLRVRTWLLLLLTSPLFIWAFLNLLFSTPWGTGILESRIEARLGLANQIKSVTWSPWAGVTISEVRILPLEHGNGGLDLCRIKEISVDPSWTSLIQGRKRWEELRIREVRGVISIEQLKLIASRFQKKKTLPPTNTGRPEKSPDEAGEKNRPTGDPSTEEKTSPPTTGDSQVPDQEQAVEPRDQKIVPEDDFEGSVIFEDCHFQIFSERVPSLRVEVQNFSGNLPVWGGERFGQLRIGNLVLGERLEQGDFEIPLSWSDGVLSIERHEMKTFGLNLKLTGALRFSSDLPFGLSVELPDQQVDLSTIYGEEPSPLRVGHLRSRTVFQGYLLSPGSYGGFHVSSFENLTFRDLRDGGETRFSHGAGSAKFNVRGIVAEDFRAIGDDDAILMNGFATAGGEAAATVRIVSSPERAESHEKRVKRASPNLSLEFSPLITPDREFRDLRIEARSGTLAIDLGHEEQWMPFFPTVRAILGSPDRTSPTLP